jgi:divalent metal cation (Fe/Co/Zn/Cd) transporter
MSKGMRKLQNSATMSSVIAEIGLTAFKIIVGFLTGSLGILAEATYSGLDLVAAVMPWFAVHVADKPADPEHPFGHGRMGLQRLLRTVSAFARDEERGGERIKANK